MINVFIGYDPSESLAYHVLAHSIIRRASVPVSITPLRLSMLHKVHDRPREPLASTEFSMSRFIVPQLLGHAGWGIFMDCDMLCLGDIADLYAMRDKSCAVQVVKHDYTPKEGRKMLGAQQTAYEKKNWSSLMMFNASKCKALTSQYVDTATGLDLHQFKWLEDERLIGGLPVQWNWLIGEYGPVEYPKMLHYTLGGPWWDKHQNVPHANLWHMEFESLLHESKEAQDATQELLPARAKG